MMPLFRPMAGTIFVLYLTLINVAAWCHVAHSLPHESAHDHPNPVSTHSPLCTWACQVSIASSTTQTSTVTLFHKPPQLENVALTPLSVSVQTHFEFRSTRAPPHSHSLL